MSRIFALPLAVALIAAAAAFYFGIQQSRAVDTAVGVTDFAFTPNDFSIDVGDTVTFSVSEGTHSVVWDSGPSTPNSGTLNAGDTFQFTPTEPGTYDFHCGIHPTVMSGVIDVAAQEVDTETPTTDTTTPETETPTNTPTNTPTPTTTAATNTPTNTTVPATNTPTRTPTSTTAPATTTATVANTPIAPDTGFGSGGGSDGFPWSVAVLGAIAVLALAGGGYAAATLRSRE